MGSKESSKDSTDVDSSEKDRDFSSLEIHDLIIKWLYNRNLRFMTKVQSLSIKAFLKKGNDVLVQSCTGSGKTLCFVIPILNMYLENKDYEFKNLLDVFALIILPTRELSIQVFDIIVDSLVFIENKGPKQNYKVKHTFKIMDRNLYCSLIIGGTTVENDLKFLNQAKEKDYVKSFIIATPGRLSHLMDLLEHEFVWTFKNLCFFILDEADRLLEMGYQNDMSRIIKHLPKQRNTGLFSATLSAGVHKLSKLCLSNQIYINADMNDSSYGTSKDPLNKPTYFAPKGLSNYYIVLNTREKLSFLLFFIQYLRRLESSKLVVFFLSCDLVDYFHEVVVRMLSNSDPVKWDDTDKNNSEVKVYKIHRKMTTKKRNRSITQFRESSNEKLNVLMCTDVFSRGIDVPKIDWIIQFDPPQDPDFYLHRIGRVSRAGSVGNALLLLTPTEESYIQFQINRKIKLDQLKDEILRDIKDSLAYSKNDNKIPFVLSKSNVEGDTQVCGGESYFDHLMKNPLKEPVLPWEVTCVVLSYLRLLNSKNRDLLLSSSKAFVSYTRAYSEHYLKNIFEKNKLDYGELATSLGVLRIPRVREILGRKIDNFESSTINPKDVPFLDSKKESMRVKELEEIGNKMDQKKTIIKDTKKVKKNLEKKIKRTRSQKRESKRKNTYDEWNEFRKEEAMVKKLKKKNFDHKNIEKFVNMDENEDLDEELENIQREIDSEHEDTNTFKKWILRGKKRKKKKKR